MSFNASAFEKLGNHKLMFPLVKNCKKKEDWFLATE